MSIASDIKALHEKIERLKLEIDGLLQDTKLYVAERDLLREKNERLEEALRRVLDGASNQDPVNDEYVEISGYDYWAGRHALAALYNKEPKG